MEVSIENEILPQKQALLALIRRIVNDNELAEDVFQTALLKALTTGAPPQKDDKVLPWFKTVLKRTAIDIVRRRKKEQTTDVSNIEKRLLEPETVKETCDCALSLLSGLSQDDQSILKDLDIEGVSPATWADQKGLSMSALKTRRHRARTRLKDAVKALCKTDTLYACDDCECD